MVETYGFCMEARLAVTMVLLGFVAACDASHNVSKSESSDNPSLIALKVPTTAKIKDDVANESFGYAVEWEYSGGNGSTGRADGLTFPSRRVSPGAWHDGDGNWYIFGGQQPGTSAAQSHYLNDLWKYSAVERKWSLLFRPETQQTTNQFPDNLSTPLLCGSRSSKRLAVHGVVGNVPKPGGNPESMQDSVVWLYDSESDRGSDSSTWTTFDACAPSNATSGLEFCPQLTKESLEWCDHSGIMMIQPIISIPVRKTGEYSTGSTTFIGATDNDSGDGTLSWWKFDVDAAEWIKLPPVTLTSAEDSPLIEELLQYGNCRVVSTSSVAVDELVYIVCPGASSSPLERSIIMFDPARGTLSLLRNIRLNNAFLDKKLWTPARSSLHATSITESNATLLFLAYQKILDLWIHDHQTGKVTPAENIWKGESLHVFQCIDHFYELVVAMEGSPAAYHFNMINPRNKLADFANNDTIRFKLTVVSDREVFLPQRDASVVIPHKLPEETLRMPLATNPSTQLPNELLQRLEAHRSSKYKNEKLKIPVNPSISVPPSLPPVVINNTLNLTSSQTRLDSLDQTQIANETGTSANKSLKAVPMLHDTTTTTTMTSVTETATKKVIPGKKVPALMKMMMKQDSGSNKQRRNKSSLQQQPPTTVNPLPEKVSRESEEAAEGDIDDHHIRNPSKILGSAEIALGQAGTVRHEHHKQDDSESSIVTVVDPTIFFAASLSFFASIGVVLFIRRCVKCPPVATQEPSVLIPEPPPIRYAAFPEDLAFHTPII